MHDMPQLSYESHQVYFAVPLKYFSYHFLHHTRSSDGKELFLSAASVAFLVQMLYKLKLTVFCYRQHSGGAS